MNSRWSVALRSAVFCVGCPIWMATGQSSTPTAPDASPAPLLRLSTPVLRSTMDQLNIDWIFLEKIPDVRLKLERPTWGPLSAAELQGRLRGVEFQLPIQGLWVGYETAAEGTEPRATVSIQRGF